MTPTTPTPSAQITTEVLGWPGTTSGIGSRGELSFKVHGREIGHLHGDHIAHFFFPIPLWRQLHAEGRITHHSVFPDREGPAARRIADAADVRDVVAMMRLNYDAAVERRRRRLAGAGR